MTSDCVAVEPPTNQKLYKNPVFQPPGAKSVISVDNNKFSAMAMDIPGSFRHQNTLKDYIDRSMSFMGKGFDYLCLPSPKLISVRRILHASYDSKS